MTDIANIPPAAGTDDAKVVAVNDYGNTKVSNLIDVVRKAGDTITGKLTVQDDLDVTGVIHLRRSIPQMNFHYLVGSTARVYFQDENGVTGLLSHDSTGKTTFFQGNFTNPTFEIQAKDAPTSGRMKIHTSLEVPAAADGDTNTAARTTAKNSATGQVQINGMEIGDTGWRNVIGDLTNGWTHTGQSTLAIRRTGNVVAIRSNGASKIDGTSATSDVALPGYSGFRSPATARFQHEAGWWSSTAGTIISNHRGLLTIGGTFVTDDAWPTTLPGTAV